MPAPTETPTARAQRLVTTMYNNMYVNINTGHHIFKFIKPFGELFKVGLKNKCVEETIGLVDDFILSRTEFGYGPGDAEYDYWIDVKTALEAM